MKNVKHGFSLIEIIISLTLLSIIFLFSFYFISTVNIKKDISVKPFIIEDYNYNDKNCSFINISNVRTTKTIILTKEIPNNVPVTSLNIFDKDKLIVTTNSATTSDSDIFIYKIENIATSSTYKLLSKYDTGPGINDAIMYNGLLYVLNTSVNSHIQIFNISGSNLSMINDFKIDQLSISYSIPKKIYLTKDYILIGIEKNNLGGELFVFKNNNGLIGDLFKILEIDGQVNSIYYDSGKFYIANASDVELFIFDHEFNLINSYDAPLSSGNGKSVFYLYPNIYLGRTVSSYELNIISYKENVLKFINKYKTNGVDFIQPVNSLIMLLTSNIQYIQLYKHDFIKQRDISTVNRINAYTCIDDKLLISNTNQLHTFILWIN